MPQITDLTREEIVVRTGAIVTRLNEIVQAAGPGHRLIIVGNNQSDSTDTSMGEKLYPFTDSNGRQLKDRSLDMNYSEFHSRATSLRDLSARVFAGQLSDKQAAGALRELFLELAPNRLGQNHEIYAHAAAQIETFKAGEDGRLSYVGREAQFADKLVEQAVIAYREKATGGPYNHPLVANFSPDSYKWSVANGGSLVVQHAHLDGFLDFLQTWTPSAVPQADADEKLAHDGGPR